MDAKFLFSRVRPNQCAFGSAVDASMKRRYFVNLADVGVFPLDEKTHHEHWFDDRLAALMPSDSFDTTQLAIMAAADSNKLQRACAHHVGSSNITDDAEEEEGGERSPLDAEEEEGGERSPLDVE